ncbi:hypothetical protein [Rhizobium tropici]|uniref:Uncharacterized protein n=2 Tax=Rhizobium/Agrobacterium group TaxID=227290 RepID=A0A6P1CGB9_RHITR|nr:hypothetical protein [Rhizobium tropici]AGB74956.1 hypothetical protein RTCIAT899_PC05815 [Rhizobium tropici CIAT 899]TGE96303.1 hypothetical protein C9417_16210 [Rhizobium sp. SEMIA 4088]MBB4242022.1 hypothetical protein [Rhizobium tropici]MBB6492347.1 hypothetical protein [Rhizobium tropici]NEV15376.1 hypothetical protein [Rhizobium tropici]
MKYLILGNAPGLDPRAAIADADIVIQINSCIYLDEVSASKTKFIFITNSGYPYDFSEYLTGFSSNKLKPTIVVARNPSLYEVKRRFLWNLNRSISEYYVTYPETLERIDPYFPMELASEECGWEIERDLAANGCSAYYMPSTGYIAFHWIKKKISANDTVELFGFTHKGWPLHPWKYEQKMMHAFAYNCHCDKLLRS